MPLFRVRDTEVQAYKQQIQIKVRCSKEVHRTTDKICLKTKQQGGRKPIIYDVISAL